MLISPFYMAGIRRFHKIFHSQWKNRPNILCAPEETHTLSIKLEVL